jgi:hypothetical protein
MSDQPLPIRSPRSVDVAPLVIQDIEARIRKGIETYGQPLRTHNGRSALRDLYEEILDAAVYLRQLIEEQEPSTPPDLVKCDGPYRYEPECQTCPSHGECWLASAATRREEAR